MTKGELLALIEGVPDDAEVEIASVTNLVAYTYTIGALYYHKDRKSGILYIGTGDPDNMLPQEIVRRMFD